MKKMFTLVIAVVLFLLSVLIVLYIAGSRMDETHVAEGSAEVQGAPSGVAARLRDIGSQAGWRKAVRRIDILANENGAIRYRETGSNGALTFVFREIEANRSFESRIDDPSQPFGGRWLITLAPAGERTRVAIREEGFVKPPIFRVLSRYAFGHDTTLKAYLKDLEAAQRR